MSPTLSFLGLTPTGESMSLTPTAPVTRRAAKRLAFIMDDVRPRTRGDVVLAYHRVGGRTVSPVDLPTAMFRRQMAHLCAAETVIDLDTQVTKLAEAAATSANERGLGVTFDDGTADFVDVALPILCEFSIPVTLYLSTAFVDTGRMYPAEGQPISWAALRDALSTGLVTIGAHTHNHVLLDRCPDEVAAEELDTCNGRIEDELGVTPMHFAYPKAVSARPSVDRLVRTRYKSAAVAGTRPNIVGDTDVWRLSRSPIQNADGWEGFTRKVAGGMRTEDDLRRVVNLVRYRGNVS